MSATSTFQIGDRVMIIPHQHKNKIATVRFFGQQAKKFGTWVGLELDEPTGDSNGFYNGEQLFECQENYGLLLRNTQVRHYDPNAPVAAKPMPLTLMATRQPGNQENDTSDGNQGFALSNSPLTTPSQSFVTSTFEISQAALLKKVIDALPLDQTADDAAEEENKGADQKKKLWQIKLETLKQKKAEDKVKKETTMLEDLDVEAQQLRQEFAPTSGIKKGENGKLVVAQQDKSKTNQAEDILKQLQYKQELANQYQSAQDSARSPTLPTGSATKPGHSRLISNADKIKAETAKLQEERKLRQGLSGLTKPSTASRNQGLTTQKSGLNQTLTKDTQDGVKKTGLTTQKTTLNSTLRQSQKDGNTSEKPTPLNRQGSSTRLGLQSSGATTDRKDTTRGSSSSRLGLQAPGSRAGSATRQVKGLSSREDKTPTKDMNSTLKRNETLNSTLRANANKTPLPSRPGTRQATDGTPVKGMVRTTLGANKAGQTPLEYKKMEAQILEKTAEIQQLQAEIQTLSIQIQEINDRHEEQITLLNAQQQAEIKRISDKHADEKIQFQTELESITERMMSINSNPDSSNQNQNQEIIEQAQHNLASIREEQNARLKDAEENLAQVSQELLELKKQESDKAQKVTELQNQVETLRQKIEEQTFQYQNEIQTLNDRLSETKINSEAEQIQTQEEIQKAQQELEKTLEESIQTRLGDFQRQNDKERAALNREMQSKDAQIRDLNKKIQDQAQSLADAEVRRLEESELAQLEIEQLKDEKDEVLQRLMDQNKVDEEDPLKDVSVDEVKIQNKKLRLAITQLTFVFEEEKKKLESALNDETAKDRKIFELEEKIKEMDFLLEEVELKEQERADMEEKLEEIVEYEKMVEEMVQEIAKKDEEMDEIKKRLEEQSDEYRLLEGLNNEFELYNKELQVEIQQKDQKNSDLNTEMDNLEIMILEQDRELDRYKERMGEMQLQIKTLSEQLQEYSFDGSKDQVSLLVERQQILFRQVREAEEKQLLVQRNFIELWQGRTYTDLVLSILPQGLQNEAQLESFGKIQQLNCLKHKATLFIRDVCEKQLDQASQIYEEPEHLNLFISLLSKLSMMMAQVINQCSIIQFQIANCTPGQYREVSNQLIWDRLPNITQMVDTLLEQLNSQSLSYSYETEDLFVELRSLDTLMTKTEKIFTGFSAEEQALQTKDGITNEKLMQTIPYQRRQNIASNCCKLKLRNQAIQLAVGVSLVNFYSKMQEDSRTVQQKCKLIYLRLLETIIKIDHIPNDDDGGDFIDVKQLNTELRLSQKFEFVQALWVGTEQDLEQARQKSWVSVLEAIERDITTLNNDFKFKRLIKIVDRKYGSNRIDFNDLYTFDFQAAGPWRQIASAIQAELQDMTTLKQKNTQLLEKQKEQMLQVLNLKKEVSQSQQIGQQLDGKLSLALAKAEQVPALEIEIKDLNLKITSLGKQLEASQIEIEKHVKNVTELTKKLEEAKKAAVAAPAPTDVSQNQQVVFTNARSAIRARQMINKHSSRQSRTNMYYDTLRNTGNLTKQDPNAGHNRNFSTVNNDKIMQQMNLQEDVYMQIISELQFDRLKLKAKDMTKRIAALNTDGSSFSSLLKQFGQKEIKLNSEEQTILQAAINEVQGLKMSYYKKLAQTRVIDLSATGKSVEQEQTEKLSQQIARAKEAVNETVSLLLSKDTKLIKKAPAVTNLLLKQGEPTPSIPQEIPKESAPISASEIKIGEIKLRGKIQLPARKIILDSNALADLRRNLAVFTC